MIVTFSEILIYSLYSLAKGVIEGRKLRAALCIVNNKDDAVIVDRCVVMMVKLTLVFFGLRPPTSWCEDTISIQNGSDKKLYNVTRNSYEAMSAEKASIMTDNNLKWLIPMYIKYSSLITSAVLKEIKPRSGSDFAGLSVYDASTGTDSKPQKPTEAHITFPERAASGVVDGEVVRSNRITRIYSMDEVRMQAARIGVRHANADVDREDEVEAELILMKQSFCYIRKR